AALAVPTRGLSTCACIGRIRPRLAAIGTFANSSTGSYDLPRSARAVESTVQRPTKFKLIFHCRDSLQSPHQRIHAFHNPPLPKSIRQGCLDDTNDLIFNHPVGRDAARSELKRAFCSSLSEL